MTKREGVVQGQISDHTGDIWSFMLASSNSSFKREEVLNDNVHAYDGPHPL